MMTLCFLPKIFTRLRLVLLDRQVIDLGRDTIHTVSSGFMRSEGKITTKQGSYKAGMDGPTLAWVDGMIIYADHLWSQRIHSCL